MVNPATESVWLRARQGGSLTGSIPIFLVEIGAKYPFLATHLSEQGIEVDVLTATGALPVDAALVILNSIGDRDRRAQFVRELRAQSRDVQVIELLLADEEATGIGGAVALHDPFTADDLRVLIEALGRF